MGDEKRERKYYLENDKNIFSSVPVQLQSITDPHRSFNIINGSTTFAVLQKRFGCKPAAL